jgi:hypothetical protein
MLEKFHFQRNITHKNSRTKTYYTDHNSRLKLPKIMRNSQKMPNLIRNNFHTGRLVRFIIDLALKIMN